MLGTWPEFNKITTPETQQEVLVDAEEILTWIDEDLASLKGEVTWTKDKDEMNFADKIQWELSELMSDVLPTQEPVSKEELKQHKNAALKQLKDFGKEYKKSLQNRVEGHIQIKQMDKKQAKIFKKKWNGFLKNAMDSLDLGVKRYFDEVSSWIQTSNDTPLEFKLLLKQSKIEKKLEKKEERLQRKNIRKQKREAIRQIKRSWLTKQEKKDRITVIKNWEWAFAIQTPQERELPKVALGDWFLSWIGDLLSSFGNFSLPELPWWALLAVSWISEWFLAEEAVKISMEKTNQEIKDLENAWYAVTIRSTTFNEDSGELVYGVNVNDMPYELEVNPLDWEKSIDDVFDHKFASPEQLSSWSLQELILRQWTIENIAASLFPSLSKTSVTITEWGQQYDLMQRVYDELLWLWSTELIALHWFVETQEFAVFAKESEMNWESHDTMTNNVHRLMNYLFTNQKDNQLATRLFASKVDHLMNILHQPLWSEIERDTDQSSLWKIALWYTLQASSVWGIAKIIIT